MSEATTSNEAAGASKHILFTPETCPSRVKEGDGHNANYDCLICHGGLAICSVCGKAEAELNGPCVLPVAPSVAPEVKGEREPLVTCPACEGCGSVVASEANALSQKLQMVSGIAVATPTDQEEG